MFIITIFLIKNKNIFTLLDKSLILNKIKGHYKLRNNADFARFLGISQQLLANWFSRNTYDIEILSTKGCHGTQKLDYSFCVALVHS